MGIYKRKTYLFVTEINFDTEKLTGAHRRFLELVESISHQDNVILVAPVLPEIANNKNISFISNNVKYYPKIPKTISIVWSLCKTLIFMKNRKEIDYSISFSPLNSICYKICGYKNIISLFRENLIGYHVAIGTSKLRRLYR